MYIVERLTDLRRGLSLSVALLAALAGPSALANQYFEDLVARADHYASTDLGSAQEVEDRVYFARKERATTSYDATHDAARFILPAGSGSIAIGDQVRLYYPRVSDGNILIFWEMRADSYFAQNGDIDGLETYKAFQLSDGGDLTLEPRMRFAQVNAPFVARTDVRHYGSGSGVASGPFDSVGGQTGEFNILPEVWTRFWVFVDFDNNRFAYWVGDENRATVPILDFVPFNWMANYGSGFGFDEFWMEFNTSQSRNGPESYLWGRNIVVLRNVSDPTAVVEAGSQGLDVASIPLPPVILQ